MKIKSYASKVRSSMNPRIQAIKSTAKVFKQLPRAFVRNATGRDVKKWLGK